MKTMYTKSFDDADEIKTPPKTRAATVKLGDVCATKVMLEPGCSGLNV
ncbi:MAG: hypothetical protein VYA17_03675 [Pseudomonadota bacterium]|nr:hypothetical protein [Pseudomonadota bacterium]